MKSHTKPSVAFCCYPEYENWRYTWHIQADDKNAIRRPTEDEAIANIFLKERGLYADRYSN